MTEYTPLGYKAMTEIQKQQDMGSFNWHEKNNEFFSDKSRHMKATASTMLKHMRQSEQTRYAEVKSAMRREDPLGRFGMLGPRDVMFPVVLSERMYKNYSMGKTYY